MSKWKRKWQRLFRDDIQKLYCELMILKRLNLQHAGWTCKQSEERTDKQASTQMGGAVGRELPAGSGHGQVHPMGLEIVVHLYEHSAHLTLHITSLISIPSQFLQAVQMLVGTPPTWLLLTPTSFDWFAASIVIWKPEEELFRQSRNLTAVVITQVTS